MEEISWRRNHGGEVMEEKSLGKNREEKHEGEIMKEK